MMLIVCLLIFTGCIVCRVDVKQNDEVSLMLRGPYTEEEIFADYSDEEILAKFLDYSGGNFVEKQTIARIVIEYKYADGKNYPWNEILGEDMHFDINYRYWITVAEVDSDDLRIAKEAYEEFKENKNLTSYTDFYRISVIEENSGYYELYIEGRNFKKMTHYYFVENE